MLLLSILREAWQSPSCVFVNRFVPFTALNIFERFFGCLFRSLDVSVLVPICSEGFSFNSRSGGWSRVCSVLSWCPQPSATVRNRSR